MGRHKAWAKLMSSGNLLFESNGLTGKQRYTKNEHCLLVLFELLVLAGLEVKQL